MFIETFNYNDNTDHPIPISNVSTVFGFSRKAISVCVKVLHWERIESLVNTLHVGVVPIGTRKRLFNSPTMDVGELVFLLHIDIAVATRHAGTTKDTLSSHKYICIKE